MHMVHYTVDGQDQIVLTETRKHNVNILTPLPKSKKPRQTWTAYNQCYSKMYEQLWITANSDNIEKGPAANKFPTLSSTLRKGRPLTGFLRCVLHRERAGH